MRFPIYFEAVGFPQLLTDYPIGPRFTDTFTRMSRDELRGLQNRQFLRVMKRGWQIPFYRRLWARHGLEPADIRSLEDIRRLPPYSKADLMQSVEEHPPFGDFHGMDDLPVEERPQVVIHTTSGTTGSPQPLFYGPRCRELQNLILARAYLFQGLRSSDVVHSVYGHGLVNGGHYVRETVLHFTNALFIPAGTGVETRSKTQIELMRHFGATVLVGFADYLRYLAEVARAMGILPGRDLKIRLISGHLARESREGLSQAWGGAELFDWYGVGDTGLIAAEGPDHSGLYVMEDAHHVDIVDPETHVVLPEGETGNICVTVLFKDDIFPIIRFNTNDLSAFDPRPSPLGLALRRLTGFLGRSDNMVKLRGINVYPTAIGEILQGQPGTTGEFICRVDRVGGRDEMTVMIEVKLGPAEYAGRAGAYRDVLRTRLGVDVLIEPVAPGALAPLTGIESRQKPLRLLDNRPHP
jgi:phenylacetate-CoA ligase